MKYLKKDLEELKSFKFYSCLMIVDTYCQEDDQPKAENVADLFNTTSCLNPPFKCPHPRIQFFLYTR